MPSDLWPYVTPGIPDHLFEQLPGIPMSKRETRLLLLAHLQLRANSVLWDIGAGTGTVAVEAALLSPQGKVIAIERDEDVANLIRTNCDRFGVNNITVIEGSAPDCLDNLPERPDCIFVEGGRSLNEILQAAWHHLEPGGRIVVTAGNLESLYTASESFADLQVRNIDVVQSATNRLENRGVSQVFVAVDPVFVLSGTKVE